MSITLLLTGCGGSGKAETIQKESVQAETVRKESEKESADRKESEEEPAARKESEDAQTGDTHAAEKVSKTDAVSDTAAADSQTYGTGQTDEQDFSRGEPEEEDCLTTLSHDGYTLEQVVVLSRHNIRSPLSGSGSVLEKITPHEWISWSSSPSELSLRGGALETMMGQYFRKWMEEAGVFPENYQPQEGAVRVYANAKQRTIATAQFFATGLLPTAGLEVETHVDYDTMDPTFHPRLTFVNDAYVRDVEKQVKELYEKEIADLADNYRLLEDVIDMEESPAWQSGEAGPLSTDDTELILEMNAEPNLSGSLKMAGRISDALVLQYYEEPDEVKAAFGHTLTEEQWRMVSEVKDTYQEILFEAPLIAPNVAHQLLAVIEDELAGQDRQFTFLCGHDSNIASVLASLGAEDFTLPDSIEKKVPIGCKLVFSRWKDADSGEWIGLDLVYQTADQLRGLTLLDIDTPPAIVPVTLKHLEQNEDGLYKEQDVVNCIDQAVSEYDEIKERYE